MTSAPEDTGKAFAALNRPSARKDHVAGIEQAHGLIEYDLEAVITEIAAPPRRVEQPGFGQDGTTLAMPALNEGTCEMARRLKPSPGKTLPAQRMQMQRREETALQAPSILHAGWET